MSTNEDYQRKSAFRITMADGLRPLLKLNFLFGISAYTVKSSGHIIFPCKTLTRIRILITLIFILFSVSITFYRTLEVLLWNPAYSSNSFERFNKMVEMISQLASNLCPLMLTFIGLFRASKISAFFKEMGLYNAGVCDFAEPLKVRKVARRFFAVHLTVMAISGCLIQLRLHGSLDPTDIGWKEKLMQSKIGESGIYVITSVFTVILVIVKQSCIAYLECFSAALATCFARVIRNLTKFMSQEAEKWNERYNASKQKVWH